MVRKVSPSVTLAPGSGSAGAFGRRLPPDFRARSHVVLLESARPLTIWLRLTRARNPRVRRNQIVRGRALSRRTTWDLARKSGGSRRPNAPAEPEPGARVTEGETFLTIQEWPRRA